MDTCRICGTGLNEMNSASGSDTCEQCKIARERKGTVAVWVEGYKRGYCLVQARVVKVRVELEDPREPTNDDFDTALRWLGDNGYIPLSQSELDTSRGLTRTRQRFVYQKV